MNETNFMRKQIKRKQMAKAVNESIMIYNNRIQIIKRTGGAASGREYHL